MKIRKLDRRCAAFGSFDFGINFVKDEREKFVRIREWCWATYGPSTELENHWINTDSVWAWESNQWNTRLYLRGDKELGYFKLKWS